ncbi:hypothetical protein ATCC90586_009008 [Pythium insidiosum]|nr:hypothetical protein ATCC90586_009008 [Pythium insidiosum]
MTPSPSSADFVFQGTPKAPAPALASAPASSCSVVALAVAPEAQEPREGCSVAMLVLLSLPRMAINMAWAAQWAALGPYLGTLLPRFAVQLTQVIGPLSGILVAPTVGVLSDRCEHAWGRRRPFLVYGGVACAVCWTLMGFTRQLGEALGDRGDAHPWTAALTIVFYTWMDVTVNVVQTPALLLVADFAGERQTLGAGIGQASSTLGSLLVAGYIQCFGAAHLTLRWFLAMLSVTMLATVGVVAVVARETPRARDLAQGSAPMRVLAAFRAIGQGLARLPRVLVVFCAVFFCAMYGFTAYNGSKGQFFGVAVLGGDATDADVCGAHCSDAQRHYNRGVALAGGLADLGFNLLGYAYSWLLPWLVRRLGARWVVTLGLVPQALLLGMAFTRSVSLTVTLVVLTAVTQSTVFALLVPIVLHVFGPDADVGMYVGALNSANCVGQLLNFVVGAALVETSMGYRLPVLVGGAVSLVGVVLSLAFFRIKMHSM